LTLISHDIVCALRLLRKQPAFAFTAILTLAIAIGGNTAMFAVVQAVLLVPLPYPNADRLVAISGGATPTRLAEMRAGARSFTGIGAFTREENPALSGGVEPAVLKGVRVSANFLQILDVEPLLGRAFRPVEDSPAAPPVVMISAELWQRRFAGDRQILGKQATLASTPYTIIGVLPPRFAFPFPGLDVWMTAPSESPLMPAKSRALSPFLSLFGRLNPGVSLAQANAEAKVIRRQYAIAHPAMLDAKPRRPQKVTFMKDDLVTDVRSMLWMLLGAVGLVLLIACANVAGLLLARAASRSRETAVRSALGASRCRLMRQLLAESVVLSVAGGILGLALARWSLRAIPAITTFELPRSQEIHLDWLVLAFATVVSLSTGLVFGLAPALSASRPDLVNVLRLSGAAANQAVGRRMESGLNLRALLLVAQVSLSLVLFIGCALLIESVGRLRGVALGFNPGHVLTASFSLSPARYQTNQQKVLFFGQLIQRLGSSPGVHSATAAMSLPMMSYAGVPVQDAAKPLLKLNERLIATFMPVTPGYFETLEIPLRGRDFSERDQEDSQRVAIIDEALARRFWPEYPRGQSPIGRHLWVGGVNPKPAEIIGIAANVHQTLEKNPWPDTVYVAFAQNPQPFATLAVRTETGPLAFSGLLREHVRQLDRDEPVSAVKSMDDLIDDQLGQRHLLTLLLGSFAAMALLLVLLGIYGMVAYSIAERTQEIGIRRALGAQPSDVLRLVVGQNFRLALIGTALGILAAFGFTRVLRDLLFEVSATDPATFVVVAFLFLLVSLVASYIPARRAARIDPAIALRV